MVLALVTCERSFLKARHSLRNAQVAQIKTPINAAQKVIGWNVIFKVERVKQPLLPTR